MGQHADYLKSVLSALRNDLVPELSTGLARHRAELIDFILTRLLAEYSAPPHLAEEYAAASEISELQALLAEVKVSETPNETARSARAGVVASIAAAQAQYRTAFEAHLARESHSIQDSGSHLVPEYRMTDASLTAYLTRRFPDRPGIRATGVTPIPGGRSKGTTAFTLESDGTAPRPMILRQDLTAQFGGLPVEYEYTLLSTLSNAQLAVAEPLWLEREKTELGGAFAAFAKAPGSPGGTVFQMGAPASAARDMAAFFGRLHALDIDAHGLRGQLLWGDSPSPVRAMLDFYYEKWTAAQQTQSVLVEAAFLWLYDHLDVIDSRTSVVHGDSNYHNVLIHEGRVSAVLDWEYAHAGDPAEDLLSGEHFTTQVLPWAEFMKIYRDNGGRDISEGRFHFFAIWRALRFAMAASTAADVYARGVNRDLRVAAIAYNTMPKLLQDVASQLLAATNSGI
jgi:aminoglycoside phosphotransferase (APT) family kinase protein